MNRTRKITYTAVGAALSAVFVCLTHLGWLKVSLLMAAALCYYVICVKCGIFYGLGTVAVSLTAAFFTGGVTPMSSAFWLDALVFAPFAVLSYFIRKLYYTRVSTAFIRLAVMAVFANVSLCLIWFIAKGVIDIDIVKITSKVGGYPVLAMLFTLFVLTFDLLFNQLSIRVIKLLK